MALEPALPRKEFELFENDMVRLRGFFSGKSPATLPILPAGPPAAPQLRTQLASRLTSGQKYRMRGMEIFFSDFFLPPIETDLLLSQLLVVSIKSLNVCLVLTTART